MSKQKIETHGFRIDEAKKYGVNRALIISTVRRWCNYKMRQKKGCHKWKDGKKYYFAYISAQSLADEMPYLSRAGIAKYLKSLINDGVLISGTYNQNKYDRTKWYSIKDEFHCSIVAMESDSIDNDTSPLDSPSFSSLKKSTKKDFVPEQEKESLKELENLSKSELKELISLLNEKKKKNTTPAKKKSFSKLELKNGWQEVWNEYLEWKKTQYRFKFKTEKSEKIAFEKLFRLSGGNIQLAEKIVRQSIENTWSGLFALTQQNKSQPQQRYGDTRRDLRATGTETRKDLR